MSNSRRSRSLSFQRSLLRWNDLRRLRKGLVRARRHPLRAGAFRDTEDVSRPMHATGMGLATRASRVALPLLLLALMLMMGRRYTLQRIDIETIVRRQVIPQLEAQYRTTIEVGPIETDWLSRVILRDVVIGRDVTSPLGALAKARAVTVYLDFTSLMLRRPPAEAVRGVDLDEPQLFLKRDARGRLNLADLFAKSKPGKTKWFGTIALRDGRLWYEDHAMRSASGRIMLADARGVDGTAEINGDGPIQFKGAADETFLSPDRVRIGKTAARGALGSKGNWITGDVIIPYIPAPLLADYAFRKGEVVAQSGTARGTIQFAWDKNRPRIDQVVAGGDLIVENVTAYARQVKEPGTQTPIQLSGVSGPVSFSGRTIETPGIRLTALNTPLFAAGTIALIPQLTFDLRARSASADTTRLLRVAKAALRNNALVQQTQITGGRSSFNLHLTGDLKNVRFSGPVRVPGFGFTSPRYGALQSGLIAATLDGEGNQNGLQLTSKVSAPDSRFRHARWGNWRSGALNATFDFAAAKNSPTRFETTFQTASVRGQMNNGAVQLASIGGDLRLAVAPGAAPQIQTNFTATGASGALPQGAARAARLQANVRLAGLQRDATFVASGVAATQSRTGRAEAGTLSGKVAWAGADLANARMRTDFRATNVLADAPTQGRVRATAANGNLFWTGAGDRRAGLPTGRVEGKANLAGVSGTWRGAGTWNANAANIIGRYANLERQPAAADITLRGFNGSLPRYGAVRGQNLRVVAATPDAPGSWSGEAIAGAVDISRVNLAAISPQAAREARDIGTVSGRVRFAGAGPNRVPSLAGTVRLSRVTVRDVSLRDVAAQIAYNGGEIRLSDATAQSDMGALRGDVSSSSAGLRFALIAPNIMLDAARINPYLRAQNLQLTGKATGSVRIAARPGTRDVYETRFDFALPATALRPLNATRPTALVNLNQARLRGSGALQLRNVNNWKFAGEAVLAAQNAALTGAPVTETSDAQIDAFGVPLWLHGARGEAVRVAMRGSVTRDANGLTPQLSGSLETETANLPLPPMAGERKAIEVREARAEFLTEGNNLRLPRFAAYALGGEWNGHVSLDEKGAVRGQLLAEKLDAAQLQNIAGFAADDQRAGWGVRGATFVKASFFGTRSNVQARVQARLYDGAFRYHETEVPLDVARTVFVVNLPDWQSVPVESLAVWSRGARASLTGDLTRTANANDIALDLKATVTDFRAARLGEFAAFADLQREAGLDGLLSADAQIGGTLRDPKVSGRAAVRLAQAFGIGIEEAGATLALASTPDGPHISLTDVSGTADGTPFSASFTADYPTGAWQAKLIASELPSSRLLRAADDLTNLKGKAPPVPGGAPGQARFPLRTLPVRGALTANISLSGALRSPDGKPAFRAQTGDIKMRADDLRWRGLPLGTLTADLALEEGVLKAEQFALVRDIPAAGDLPATQAVWRLSGDLPTSETSPTLNANISLENERLSFFFDALTEAQRALKLRATTIPVLDQIVSSIEKMPRRLDGTVGLQANLQGRWNKPAVAVKSLTVSDTRARGPLGVEQALPALNAAFTYDGKAITIQNAVLRLEAERQKPQPGEKTEDREDVVLRVEEGARIVPGGEISLEANVINANLSQLAPWVSALRNADGSALLRGEIAQFAFVVSGTTKNPNITGAVTAENISYNRYTVDSLRISRFDIANGFLEIQQPNLTITKGAFQSSAAWGRIPWSWEEMGPPARAPLEVHLPLGREDLGAMAGTFVPALARADAEAFSGSLDITGTIDQPQIGGEITIRNGQFRLKPQLLPIDAGLSGVTGRIRFAEGNRVFFSGLDGVGALRGQVVPPETVEGKTTGNVPGNGKNGDKTAATENTTKLSGAFALGGDVQLSGLSPEYLARPVATLSHHRYNLALEVSDAQISTDTISGLRDLDFALLWRTGPGQAATSHNVRWMMAGSGTPPRRRGSGGRVYTLGSLDLAPDFSTSFTRLMHSSVRSLRNADDFQEFAVHKQFAAASAALGSLDQPQPARVVLSALNISLKGTVVGQLDGILTLDNRPVRPRTLPTTPRPSVSARLASTRRANAGILNAAGSWRPPLLVQGDAPAAPAREELPAEDNEATDNPIRVAGEVTLSQATLSGTPVGGVSAGVELPAGPALDLDVNIGREVEFSMPNVRATVTGGLEISGTPRDPLVSGTVQIPTGQIRFPTAQARITEGELQISAFRDPETGLLRTLVDIDASARGQAGRYTITLVVSGPLDFGSQTSQNLKIDVTTNPPLSRDQAFTLLLGTTGAREGQTGLVEESYRNAILGLVASPLLSGIEQSLQRALGFDTVTFDYRFNQPTVEIGEFIGDKIYISYRRVLKDIDATAGATTENAARTYTLRMEYRLKSGLQIGVEQSGYQQGQNRYRVTAEKTWRF